MILANGEVFDSSEQSRILAGLEERINQTRAEQTLRPETVIAALDKMSRKLTSGMFDKLLTDDFLRESVSLAARMLRRDVLEHKVRTELGEDIFTQKETLPLEGFERLLLRPEPLGTLMHIAAGNMDALPAYSVIEGLLTGNINLLKLPQADNGLTIIFFQELFAIEPKLRDFVYVFDTPSSDVEGMRKIADCCDGLVVWGGEAAVRAVRTLVPPGCKLIEWGHRLGFAYVSGYADREGELSALAEHIMVTKQLLCSSCQVIYLDTEDMEEVRAFGREFLPYLEAAARKHPVTEIGAVAEMTLRRYAAKLEGFMEGEAPEEILQGEGCSLTVCTDSELELSYMYGNCLVKRLPSHALLRTLRRNKGTLQTAGLICAPERKAKLTELLVRSGVNRVLPPGKMSNAFAGEAHDGEYPLRRYTRMVNLFIG